VTLQCVRAWHTALACILEGMIIEKRTSLIRRIQLVDVIDWDRVKVVGHESDRKTRWIKEAVAIRKSKDKCMNRDTGSYFLPTSYDKLLLRKAAHFH